jgi:DNA polymerase-4
MDAFFASVEEIEHPELRGHPLVIAGNTLGDRGVVSTANYLAREFGVHSAMPVAEARRLCPQANFVPPSIGLYSRYSRRIWEIIQEMAPAVERAGMDEGYLDLGPVSVDEAVARARAIQARVQHETQLTCSLGIAMSKVVAKVASDRDKPAGMTVVVPGEEQAFLSPLPVRALPGVGPKSEERLRALNVSTIGELAALDDAALESTLTGKMGQVLRERARGISSRSLDAPQPPVSYSEEETFPADVHDRERLHAELVRLAGHLAERLCVRGEAAYTVSCKVRYPDLSIRTRTKTLSCATDDPRRIAEVGYSLLLRALLDRDEPLRLVGLRLSGLANEYQMPLF